MKSISPYWGGLWWCGSVFFLLFIPCPSVIQGGDCAFQFHPVGAQATGVGGVGVAHINSAEGLFWNPAAVVFGKKMALFATYDRPFDLAALESQAISSVIRWKQHGFGGTYEGFGSELYREQAFGGVYGYRISHRVGIGARVRTLTLTVAGHQKQQWTVFDLGLRIVLNKTVQWGAVAWNATGVRTGILGQGGAMGFAAQLAEGANLFASVQKESGMPTGFGVGIQNQVVSSLVLRVGIGSQPERFSAGFGLQHSWFKVDYAGIWHTVLGMSHRVSLHIEK